MPVPSWLQTYGATIAAAAQKYGVPPSLLAGLIQQESGGNPNAVGSSGELGLTQILPSNDAALGITNPLDPNQQIYGAAELLSQNYASTNDWFSALEMYNGGPNYANKPVTQTYANAVEGWATQFEGDFATATEGAESSGVASNGGGNTSTSVAYGIPNPLDAVGGSFARIGLIVLGAVIIIVALWQLLSTTGAVPSPGDTAKLAGHAAAAAI